MINNKPNNKPNNNQFQPTEPNELVNDTFKNVDTGPNAIQGSVRNYDDDFLMAHATKSDDMIFEELLYYINYKKQRGDYISYDEKVQIDRYCSLLLRQLKVNRLWREEQGISNMGGYTNIPPEFYEAVDGDKLPIITLYHKEPGLMNYAKVEVRVPSEQLDNFKQLKLEDPDAGKVKGAKSGGNVLYTIDVSAANNQVVEDKYAGMTEKEIKKMKKQEAKEAKKHPQAANKPAMPGQPSGAPYIPGKPGVPNIPGRPAVPGQAGAPNIPGRPGVPTVPGAAAAKPKGVFDL